MREVYSHKSLPQETNKQTKNSKNLTLHLKQIEKEEKSLVELVEVKKS